MYVKITLWFINTKVAVIYITINENSGDSCIYYCKLASSIMFKLSSWDNLVGIMQVRYVLFVGCVNQCCFIFVILFT